VFVCVVHLQNGGIVNETTKVSRKLLVVLTDCLAGSSLLGFVYCLLPVTPYFMDMAEINGCSTWLGIEGFEKNC
jgi:hypothetical protein